MTTDIKQAVRELREATREHCPHQDRKGEHETYTHETAEWYCRACGFVADWTVESRVVELRGALISQQYRADSYMGGVAERHLPAVLDRLEELEASADWKAAWYALDEDARKLTAERDAINAKFAEFRAAIEEFHAVFWDSPHVDKLGPVLTRFPALDSSGDETEET